MNNNAHNNKAHPIEGTMRLLRLIIPSKRVLKTIPIYIPIFLKTFLLSNISKKQNEKNFTTNRTVKRDFNNILMSENQMKNSLIILIKNEAPTITGILIIPFLIFFCVELMGLRKNGKV